MIELLTCVGWFLMIGEGEATCHLLILGLLLPACVVLVGYCDNLYCVGWLLQIVHCVGWLLQIVLVGYCKKKKADFLLAALLDPLLLLLLARPRLPPAL